MDDPIEIKPYEVATLPGNRLIVYHDGDEESAAREVQIDGETYWELMETSGRWRVRPLDSASVEVSRLRAITTNYELKEFREKLSALAAIEVYMGESGENAARNIRDLLDGVGDNDNDPRVQARKWELEF